MAELFVVGGLAFWIAMLAWFIILWVLVEKDHGFLGLLSLVAYGCLLQFGFKMDVVGWILSHPIPLIIFGCLYFFIGAGWGFWLWFLFAKDQKEPYLNKRTDWLVSKGETKFDSIPISLKEEWAKYVNDHYEIRNMMKPPLVRDHKAKVMRWIGYWPLSLITWAFNDMIRRFVKMVYNYIHDWLQGIANRVFADIKQDLPQNS